MYYEKLNELTGYRQFEELTLQQYLQSLVDKHKIKVASGNFSVVLIPPDKDYVYKIWSDDKGFDVWVNYCVANQGKYSFLPKIYGKLRKLPHLFIRGEEFKNTVLKIARIEKLKPCRNSIINYIADGRETGKYFVFYIKDILDETITPTKATSGVSNVVDMANYGIPILKKLKEDNDLEYDIKIDNFSKRANGEVVITDPFWCGYYEPQFTMPGMMDNLDLIATGRESPQLKSKLIVGKNGKAYTGDNEQALATVAITWKSYLDSNYTQDIMLVMSGESYKNAREFAKSMVSYSHREDITDDINQPKFIKFQELMLAIFYKHPIFFEKILQAYSGPFPLCLLDIDFTIANDQAIDYLLYSLPNLQKSNGLDKLMMKLDDFASNLFINKKNIEQARAITRAVNNRKYWKNFPSKLKVNDPSIFKQ